MERQDIPPLELQLYAQLPQRIEDLWDGPKQREKSEGERELERLAAQIQNGTMSAIERQQVRSNLMRLLGASQNGMEENIMAAFHLLDRQTPPEELGECFLMRDHSTKRERTGP